MKISPADKRNFETVTKHHRPEKHGIDCEKALHVRDGYLHAEDDDTPFNVDGIDYCGRCHRALG